MAYSKKHSRIRSSLGFGVVVACWWLFLFWMLDHDSNYPQYFGRYSTLYLAILTILFAAGIGLTYLLYHYHRKGLPRLLQSVRSLLLFGVFTIGTSLLITEGLVRTFDLLGASFYREITNYILELVPDPYVVYKHKSNFDAIYQGVNVNTNELGLRDSPIRSKQEHEYRILVLGDSVTFGWGVEESDVFSTQLEQMLNPIAQQPIELINSGVCGYNTRQELEYLRNYGLDLEPDALLLIYVDNDIDPEPIDINAMRRKWQNPDGIDGFALRYSWLYRIVHHVLPYLAGTGLSKASEQDYADSFSALHEIVKLSRDRQLPLTVVFFRLTQSDRSNRLAKVLKATAQQDGFNYVDLLSEFENRDIRQVTNSIIDIHPNKAGHFLVAQRLKDELTNSLKIFQRPN